MQGNENTDQTNTQENIENVDETIETTESATENQTENQAENTQTVENTEEISAEISLEEQNLQLKAEIAEAKDKNLRLYAEFENFRRRTAKEKLEMTQFAGEKIITSMLTILDDFERAQKSLQKSQARENPTLEDVQKSLQSINDGMQLIQNKFVRIMEQQGLKPMANTIGTVFNIDLHESITQIPAPNEDMIGKVVDEVEKGYLLNDKVVRFAKVVIGS